MAWRHERKISSALSIRATLAKHRHLHACVRHCELSEPFFLACSAALLMWERTRQCGWLYTDVMSPEDIQRPLILSAPEVLYHSCPCALTPT